MDAAILSRAQFAFTVSYHILFPTLTIGLALYIAIMEGAWLKTRKQIYLQQAKFWLKPFAITFGMGVVSGIVLSYEFGTNFSKFSEQAGAVIGPLMSYEVLSAFFLEAGFLGIMLFGWDKVSERVHFAATATVAVGTMISAFWILSANSWMQTPQGVEWTATGPVVLSWWEVIFNPSFPYRLTHMLMASFITTGFVIAGVSAYLTIKHREFSFFSLKFAIIALAFLTPLQAYIGDLHGLNVKEHQPIKVAAMEGIWETEKGAGLRLFAIPDQEKEMNHFEIKIPHLASLILTHKLDGEIQGLKSVPKEDRPPVAVVFYSFRIMVGLGILMILTAWISLWFIRKKDTQLPKRLRQWLMLMIPSGFIATLAGWWVVEVGRQPFLVYGHIRTHDVISDLPPSHVAFTLFLFITVYTLLFGVYLYFMRKVIRKGPSQLAEDQIKVSLQHLAMKGDQA
ncbi:cytochrome ubiquinol oxidase subunit I [Algicola sagamiensis]|uniref:cytochrome ubiquinol oxidase subunit I n=1 Tax=Algicola sagamiensis TaxID=163869 RepID=UPI0003612150|nr:cytochrome ubiquinol oxidase subunit I [Algicola sagamiensis]